MMKNKLTIKDFTWTQNMAYAIGLLATDGCLSSDGRHIIMRSSDIDLLETFKTCLGLNNKIGKTRNGKVISYRVQFGDVQFYDWLIKIGLFPAKTYTIGEIDVPDNLFRDFLRGHLDGDGSIQKYVDRYNIYKGRIYTNQRIFVRFTSASRVHIEWLRKRIIKLGKLNGALIYKAPRDQKHVPIWDLKFAKKESIKLLQWIYYKPYLPSLQRKMVLAMRTLNELAHEKRKEYTMIGG